MFQICLQIFFVTFSLAQYYPQQQYYYPQQEQQQQYYYQQPQQQQQQQTLQWPQQNVVYQQQTFAQQQQFQQPQQSSPSTTPQQFQPAPTYKEGLRQQQHHQRLQKPKISKPDEAFDLPQPPSRFLPDGSKFIKPRVNQNSRRGGQILNQRRPSSPTFSQPQRRIDVAHTRAPPTHIITASTPRTPPSIKHLPSKSTPAVTRSPSLPASQLSSSRDPNKFFLDCCQRKNVAKSCERRCNFDKLSKRVLTGMFLGTDICPQRHGLDLFSCAAQDGDHRDCCRAKNVGRTGAGDKCLNFCLMTPDSNFQADASYLPCWAVLTEIKQCFRESIINGHTL
jgi:hypothetical protein